MLQNMLAHMKSPVSWAHGLISAFVIGFSNAGLNYMTLSIGNDMGVADIPDPSTISWKAWGMMILFGGVLGAFAYLQKAPLPPLDSERVGAARPAVLLLVAAVCGSALLVMGCWRENRAATGNTTVATLGNQTQGDVMLAEARRYLGNPVVQETCRVGLTLIGKRCMRKAVAGAEREEIAAQMWTLAKAFRTLASGEAVTPEDVQRTVNAWVAGWSSPDDNELIEAAGDLWETFYPMLKDVNDVALWRVWLSEVLAAAAEDSAAKWTTADGT